MKILGSLRRVDCVEAEIVLASGVYLTFRLNPSKNMLRHVIEVKRSRMHQRPRESILVDAYSLQVARRGALDAIMAHRRAMHIRVTPEQKARSPFQLRFKLF